MSAEIAGELSKQTKELVTRFEERANSLSRRGDLTALIVQLDRTAAERAARLYFGEGEFTSTGIDGSMDYDERLQMMIFYSNATAYSCPFSVGQHVVFDLDSARRDSKLSASAAVPLWAEDIADVISREPEIDIELEHSMERIPNAFMTLGEFYLAVKATESSRLLFLDRPLSGTFATLSRDARNLLKRGKSRLVDWSRGRSGISMLDIFLAVHLGSPTMHVPPRGTYISSAVVRELLSGPMTLSSLASSLHTTERSVEKAVKRLSKAESWLDGKIFEECGPERFKLTDGALGYWERVASFALDYSSAIFDEHRHPLLVGGDEHLTVLDVNTTALFLLCYLHQVSLEKKCLLVGVAKDTTATDIARAVLPFATARGFIRLDGPQPRLKNDRTFLAILSAENPSVQTPWRTVGYDSAFSTVVHNEGEFRSARKVVSRERLFIRSFFQLRTFRSDQAMRSQVFLFDRVFDPGADSSQVRSFKVVERSSETEVSAYFEGKEGSDASNLILYLLSLCDNPEVFEAFGHNQLLYLADKAVKAEVRLLRSSLRGVADLRVGGLTRRRRMHNLITTFREQRAEAEHGRMSARREA
jgi:hypothetical protein